MFKQTELQTTFENREDVKRDLNAEAERANEYRRLTGKAQDLRKRLEAVKGGSESGDAQLDVLQGLLEMTPVKMERRHLEVGLAILVALLVELGSGLGLFIATTPWREVATQDAGKEASRRKQPEAPKRGEKGRAMAYGAVEEFMLARLEPRPGGQLTNGDLFFAYKIWCTKAGVAPHSRSEFKTQFAELAKVAGIVFSGNGSHGGYRDVALSALGGEREDHDAGRVARGAA